MKSLVEYLTEAQHKIEIWFEEYKVTSLKWNVQETTFDDFINKTIELGEEYILDEDLIRVDANFSFFSSDSGQTYKGFISFVVNGKKNTIESNGVEYIEGDISVVENIDNKFLHKEIQLFLSNLYDACSRYKVTVTVDVLK